MMCGYLGLQFNRFGQSNKKNGVSILVKATVQFLTGSAKELNLFVEIWKSVFLKGSFSITVLLAFWLIGFPLANCRSDSPFMAYKFSELYVYNEASNANIFAKFTVQVRNRMNSKNVISIIHFFLPLHCFCTNRILFLNFYCSYRWH